MCEGLMKHSLICLVCLSLGFIPLSTFSEEYKPTTTVEETMQQFRKLPANDIWWTVNGPSMRWNNLNLAKFVPALTVYRDGPVRELAYRPMPQVGAFEIETPEGKMPFKAFLDSDQSTTMSVLLLHKGKIVFEYYPRQQAHDKPLFWSVTKAFVSTVLAILEDRGQVDVSKPVDHYIPKLKDSPYGGVKIRDVLDMASGIDCADEYEDKTSCYYRYSASIGEGYRGPDAADNPYDYIAGLPAGTRWGEPGTGFSYSGVDTFVLGWLVEEITGMPFQDALSKEVWTQLGAESDALIWAGRYGIPLTSGGLMARVRDMARFGLLFTPSYQTVASRKIISDRYLDIILNGGRPELLENSPWGNIREEGVRHNVYQWDTVYTNDDFAKFGWAGQGLLINPKKDLVAVWTGYFREDGTNVGITPMVRAIFENVFPE
jgi:CubicO group peptidase (beta-lactamase class C family)